MSQAARTLLTLVVLGAAHLAWGGPDSGPRAEDKSKPPEPSKGPSAGALLDRPQEVTLLLFNGQKRPVYLLKLTPDELTYKQSEKGTEVVKYAARDGAVKEVHTAQGGTFVLNGTSGTFEVGVAEPVPGEKPKDPKLKLTSLEQAILDLANKEREKESLPPLKPNEKLFQIARAHSVNMATQDKLDHVLDSKNPLQRAKEAGYSSFVAENVAWGAPTAAEVMRMWMNSPGHKANLLHKNAVEVGIGAASSLRTGPYYTMVFGLRKAP